MSLRALLPRGLLVLSLGLATSHTQAIDFRSLADHAAIFDAGSKESKPLFILQKGTPVEVIVTLEKWAKVREAGGGIGWLERANLTDRKQLLVVTPQVEIRQAADGTSKVLAIVAKDVLLEWVQPPVAGFVKVKYQDGTMGFVPIKSVWGI